VRTFTSTSSETTRSSSTLDTNIIEWNVFVQILGGNMFLLTFSTEDTARAFVRDYRQATGARLLKDDFGVQDME
jgi:hypothetical protein